MGSVSFVGALSRTIRQRYGTKSQHDLPNWQTFGLECYTRMPARDVIMNITLFQHVSYYFIWNVEHLIEFY